MKKFEEVIEAYLDQRAAQDEQFARSYAKEGKSIEMCCRYILGEASAKAEAGCAALPDDEVYGLAVHYYDEDDIKIKPVKGSRVSVPEYNGATYEPTEEDKENAKKAALRRLEEDAYNQLHKPSKKRPKAKNNPENNGQLILL